MPLFGCSFRLNEHPAAVRCLDDRAGDNGNYHRCRTDPSGGVLANAEVTASTLEPTPVTRPPPIRRELHLANAAGRRYRLSVGAAGFKRYEVANVVTQVNEITRVDITMAVGAVSESIEVSAQVVNVNTEDASLRTVVDQRRVEDLPLNGRDPVQLMRLVAGVSLYNGSGSDFRHYLSRRGIGVGERQPRQLHELHSRRRPEQRPLQQRAEPDAESRMRCRNSAFRPTTSARSSAATRAASSTPSRSPAQTISMARRSGISGTTP